MISEGVIVAVVTTIIAPTIAWLLKRSNKNLENIDNNLTEINTKIQKTADGTLAITRYRLLKEMARILERGTIGVHELKELSLLYESYKNLGGNSVVTELFERCQDLPLKKEDK